jgi:hypothetical protein
MKKVILTTVVAIFAMMVYAQTKNELKPADLSKPITEYVKQNMPTYTITKAFKVDSKGVITFDVVVTKGAEKRLLVFDKDGKFVKKGDQETKTTFKNAKDPKAMPPAKTPPAKEEKASEPKK